MMDQEEYEAVVEAVLFVTSEPVPRERILELFGTREQETANAALEAVLQRYRAREDDRGRGIMLDEALGGMRLVTRPELHGYLRKFFEAAHSNRLTMAALETLATVAYRQPITAPEIQEIRGKNSVGVLKTLLERRLVRISGRKDVVGKPFLYSTTRDFLLHFGLDTIEDLPPLEEFEEAFLSEGDFADDDRPADREEEVLQQLALIDDADEADRGEELEEPNESDQAEGSLETAENAAPERSSGLAGARVDSRGIEDRSVPQVSSESDVPPDAANVRGIEGNDDV